MAAALGAIGHSVGNAVPTSSAHLPPRWSSHILEQSHANGAPQSGRCRVHDDRRRAALTLAASACPAA